MIVKNDMLEELDNFPNNPWEIIQQWYDNACISEPNDPNAASLASIDEDGLPSCRIILLKQLNEKGIHFCTQSTSAKGVAVATNENVALVLYWKSLHQQIRIVGRISVLPDSFADKYFQARSKQSCIAARVSKQSQEMLSYNDLMNDYFNAWKELKDKEIKRPQNWVAYNISPNVIECWQDGKHRLHKRICFKRQFNQWQKYYLYP